MRTVGLWLEDEWAQNVPQYVLVILFVSSNYQPDYGHVHMNSALELPNSTFHMFLILLVTHVIIVLPRS